MSAPVQRRTATVDVRGQRIAVPVIAGEADYETPAVVARCAEVAAVLDLDADDVRAEMVAGLAAMGWAS